MKSLFDELTEKLAKDPRLTKRGGPRVDLGLLLFNARDDLRALWLAAERECAQAKSADPSRGSGRAVSAELASAVEALRPIFGQR